MDQAQGGPGLYKQVFKSLLPNDRAKREDIRRGLNWLMESTTSRDVAVLFLSGHGQNDARGHYHFLPFDTDLAHLNLTTILDDDIQNFLTSVPGKVIVFLDTCSCGLPHADGGRNTWPVAGRSLRLGPRPAAARSNAALLDA